jgi:predicted dehydrogenase
MIGIGVIGYGYWGPNLVRNFAEVDDAEVVIVADLRSDRLATLHRRYPAVRTTDDPLALISDAGVDAVVIATPVSTHFELAMETLRAGKHVLVEKPMTATTEQSRRLVDEANRRERILQVDHTFIYTPAVRKIRELVDANALGEIYYYDSVRINLGLFQHDVNVMWDLAVHDLSIMQYVVPSRPSAVSATAVSHVRGQPENTAYLTIYFEDNVLGHLHVNWLAPVKIRRTLIGGSQKMVVYDDLEPSEKIKVFDKGINVAGGGDTVKELLIGYRSGDMWAPKIEVVEALRCEAEHFVSCIRDNKRPDTDGEAGLSVVQLAEAATRSAAERGRPIDV